MNQRRILKYFTVSNLLGSHNDNKKDFKMEKQHATVLNTASNSNTMVPIVHLHTKTHSKITV